MSDTVEYREIQGHPGYRVGSDGTVWNSWVNCRWGRRRADRWKQLKPGVHGKGYLYVNLTPPAGKYRTFRVHRLVLGAFVGPCPPGMECRHLNGVKTDCRLENLAWGSPEENRQDNHRAGSYGGGEGHTQAVLTEAAVRQIRDRYAAGGVTQKQLAAEHGVAATTVAAVLSRRSWKHLG